MPSYVPILANVFCVYVLTPPKNVLTYSFLIGKPAKITSAQLVSEAEEEELRSQENERLGSAVESMQEAGLWMGDEGIPKL